MKKCNIMATHQILHSQYISFVQAQNNSFFSLELMIELTIYIQINMIDINNNFQWKKICHKKFFKLKLKSN